MKRTKPSKTQSNQAPNSSPSPKKEPKKQAKKSNNNNHKNGNGNGNGLTTKQEIFVQEYLIDFNASRAAKEAGYSDASAGVMGCNNLKIPKVQEAIQIAMDARADRTKVTQDKVVKELAKLAFSNMRSIVTWSPKGVQVIDSDKLAEEDAACVMEVAQTETQFGTSIKVRTYNKKDALELLGKHLGMFSETIKNVHIGDGGGPVQHEFNFSDKNIKSAYDMLYGKEGGGSP